MINFDISTIRKANKLLSPHADFDSAYTFYYDETNNIKKLSIRETGFNYPITGNFVLGGVVHEGIPPDVQVLFDGLRLQKTVKEIKLKHIATGDFLDCLKSDKLNYFLSFILGSPLYIHYSSLNFLYWSIVDIVDSAVANSEASLRLGPQFSNHLKNDLYKLAKLEIKSVTKLFFKFQYPNIKKEYLLDFIEALMSLFDEYVDSIEFHLGLTSLKQILKESKRKGALPFIMDEDDLVLIKNLSHFYFLPVYMFKYSSHIFDNEASIAEWFAAYKLLDGTNEIKNFSFVDSQSNPLIQISDVLMGLMGKLTAYINASTRESIVADYANLSSRQLANIDLLIEIIDKSNQKNIGFLHSIDSYEERAKMSFWEEVKKSM